MCFSAFGKGASDRPSNSRFIKFPEVGLHVGPGYELLPTNPTILGQVGVPRETYMGLFCI
jgi:hypothetical protein